MGCVPAEGGAECWASVVLPSAQYFSLLNLMCTSYQRRLSILPPSTRLPYRDARVYFTIAARLSRPNSTIAANFTSSFTLKFKPRRKVNLDSLPGVYGANRRDGSPEPNFSSTGFLCAHTHQEHCMKGPCELLGQSRRGPTPVKCALVLAGKSDMTR